MTTKQRARMEKDLQILRDRYYSVRGTRARKKVTDKISLLEAGLADNIYVTKSNQGVAK